MCISSALVLPFAASGLRRTLRDATPADRRALVLSGLCLGLHFALWITSLRHTSVASSVLLVSTNPLWVGLGGWLVLGERVERRTVLGTLTALVGTAIVSAGDWGRGEHALGGDLLALAGAAAVSGYLLIGRQQRQRLALLPYTTVVYSTAAVALGLLALLAGNAFTGYPRETYLLFGLLALGPQLLGHGSFNYALSRVSPGVVALALLAEPIAASALAYAVLGEAPGALLAVGAVVILGGIGAAVWPCPSSQRRTVPESASAPE